jgi:hypothetical protein
MAGAIGVVVTSPGAFPSFIHPFLGRWSRSRGPGATPEMND